MGETNEPLNEPKPAEVPDESNASTKNVIESGSAKENGVPKIESLTAPMNETKKPIIKSPMSPAKPSLPPGIVQKFMTQIQRIKEHHAEEISELRRQLEEKEDNKK